MHLSLTLYLYDCPSRRPGDTILKTLLQYIMLWILAYYFLLVVVVVVVGVKGLTRTTDDVYIKESGRLT